MTDLLNCPFCGRPPHFWKEDLGPNCVNPFVVNVRCIRCSAQQRTSGDDQEETLATAIAAWNRRAALADHPTVKALVAEAEARVLEGLLTDSTVQFAMNQQICCDGRECGCRGADVGSYIEHLAEGYRAKAAAIRKETT